MHLIDLRGAWEMDLAAGEGPLSLDKPVEFSAPGDTITALLDSDLIPSPAFGRNELDLQWIGRCDWIIRRSFNVDPVIAEEPVLFFTADSLDTVATVTINGTVVAESDNMFTRVRTQIPAGTIRSGTNEIEILFRSPELEAVRRAADLPYPVPHSTFDVQSPHRNLLRKVQCHSGWDWGPSLMVCGINGTIGIVSSQLGLVEYIQTRVIHQSDAWGLSVAPILRIPTEPSGTIPVAVTVIDPSGTTVASRTVDFAPDSCHSVDELYSVPPVVITIDNPALWWPAGDGDQPLYAVQVEAFGHKEACRVGLRTIDVRRDVDEHGAGFAFVVNGREIFARGANWIPQDALPGSARDDDLVDLLESARNANMNMIRVWGGGTYESDRFYELCDELGIMVWQDFMFSCSLYPADKSFLESVSAEVHHQVRRLQSHACIALWCGNNENVGALTWYEESRGNRDRYLVDYDRLNEGVIGNAVRALDPDRLFWPSSPAAGPADYSVNWTVGASGDMHYWSVWHSAEPFSSYRTVIPRFCSEFGFQSFPSRHVVDGYTDPEQRNVTSPQMEHHQRSPAGNELIIRTMARYYRIPATLDQQIYVSQVQQAVAIKTAVEYWRSTRPRCMGTLFWQLNDTWPTASWASIEYGGNWKLLHYAAREFFDPVLILALPLGANEEPLAVDGQPASGWSVHVVNETMTVVAGTARMTVYTLNGAVVAEREETISVEPKTSRRAFTWAAEDIPANPAEVFAVLDLETGDQGNRRNWYFLADPKQYNLPRPEIRTKVSGPDGDSSVSLESDLPAFHVALSVHGQAARFSDNNLLLMPGDTRTISVETALSTGEIGENLSITHLGETGVSNED